MQTFGSPGLYLILNVRASDMAQVVKRWLSKHKALRSNSSTIKKKERKKERK
jgi:hypothetical protein